MNNKFNYDGVYSKKYYLTTSKENQKFKDDFRFREILKFIKNGDIICDFGCGDASKLALFRKYADELWGFDKSKHAILKAKKKYPYMHLFTSDSGIDLPENKFDITLSTYTLEHVDNPEKFIKDMIRVTKKGGYIINICPNFGSPFFPSPPSIQGCNFPQKIAVVIRRLFFYKNSYRYKIYKNIEPIVDAKWEPDYDTVSEISLARVVKMYKKKIVYASSFWQPRPLFYSPLYLLGILGIPPFKYWGGDCFFVILK